MSVINYFVKTRCTLSLKVQKVQKVAGRTIHFYFCGDLIESPGYCTRTVSKSMDDLFLVLSQHDFVPNPQVCGILQKVSS